MRPFLRWVGGKNWLMKDIDNYLPENIDNYYEPFLGGGSMFFYLKSKERITGRSYLSDSNKDLINTYKIIKSNVYDLITILRTMNDSKEEYYRIRNMEFETDVEKAAKFIYLNRTSFNGVYRVNKNGIYNVPYGNRNLKKIVDEEHLYLISQNLKNCFFSTKDFKKIKGKVRENDFIFLDPPYTVAHENNGFIHYNQSLFSWNDQIELANFIDYINTQNARFLVTNAAHISIYNLYQNRGNISTLSRPSTIGGIGAKRAKYNEILLKNY
jgi:DNA adenine methylase